mgnify:FL=1|jgi:hypothetical protein
MTKEQIANLHVGDEIWLAKFRLGYNAITHKITALLNYKPTKFVIRHYLCDNDFKVVGFFVDKADSNFVDWIRVEDLIDGIITDNIKYATSKKEITEWYENRKREEKGLYMKRLEEAAKALKEETKALEEI